jgi:transmembrane sensor
LSDNKNIITDELLAKYFAGNATELETILIESWRQESLENQKYFDGIKLIWEKSSDQTQNSFDVNLAWNKVKGRVDSSFGSAKIIELTDKNRNFNLVMKIAASVVVLIGISLAYYTITKQPETEQISEIKIFTTTNTLSDTLPDGTIVFLNKNSMISYNSDFGKTNRTILLNGEAYFEVEHKRENNFTVKANDVIVRDIGTIFNIKTMGTDTTEVIVSEGSVMMKTPLDSILVIKGNKVKYNRLQKKIIRETNTDINFDAYRSKTIIFDRTEMYKVIEILNEIYNTKIEIENENLKSCKLTVTFKNESIDSILGIIEATFSIKSTKSETGFKLSGNGCLN